MTISDELRAARDALVREHMDAENRLDFSAALAAFARPRDDLIGTDQVCEGPAAVADYFRRSRLATVFMFEGDGLINERVYFNPGAILGQITDE